MALVLGISLLLVPAAAQAVVIISDSFTATGTGGRTVGSPLQLTTTEVGGVKWGASNTFKFTAGDIVQNASGNQQQVVPYVVTADTTVSADFNYNGYSSTGTNYGMIGFNNVTPTQPYTWSLWLFVRGTGAWELRQGGTALASGTGLAPTTGWHTLKVEYDPTTLKASAWFDTTQLAANKTLTAPPTMSCIGFGDGNIANMRVDNFAVDVVPEPMTLALLAMSALGLLRRRVNA